MEEKVVRNGNALSVDLSFIDTHSCKLIRRRSGFLKPSTNRMLTRIKSVYFFIQKNGTVTTQDIVEEFGITPRTIQRDLNVLAYNDLVMSPSRGQWRAKNKKIRLTS